MSIPRIEDTDTSTVESKTEIERLRKVIAAMGAAIKDDASAQARAERNFRGLRSLKKIDIAFAAIGGEAIDKGQCHCDPDVNWYCEYCAIHDALRLAKKALILFSGGTEAKTDGEP